MIDLLPYKTMPRWNADTIPEGFKKKHNTVKGTWAKLTIFSGSMTFQILTETGELVEAHYFSVKNQPIIVEPQLWHRIESVSDDIECQLQFLCRKEEYFTKKYQMTAVHSEVIEAMEHIQSGSALDLGSGAGRNALYLALKGFDVTATDLNQSALEQLHNIIKEESLSKVFPQLYDIQEANLNQMHELIVATVVFMFLAPDRIPHIIKNMQQQTTIGGYNLIVCAMSTEDFPCPLPFSFTFKENELIEYYRDWDCIKYNEDVGEMHHKDSQGNPLQLRFATLLAKKRA